MRAHIRRRRCRHSPAPNRRHTPTRSSTACPTRSPATTPKSLTRSCMRSMRSFKFLLPKRRLAVVCVCVGPLVLASALVRMCLNMAHSNSGEKPNSPMRSRSYRTRQALEATRHASSTLKRAVGTFVVSDLPIAFVWIVCLATLRTLHRSDGPCFARRKL